MRILVVEGDRETAASIRQSFHDAGYITEHADNGRDGLFMAASERFDAIILERLLPGSFDGLKLLKTLRAQKNPVPVLILSSMAAVADRIEGLEAGSDDYLPKPFDMTELLARIEALGRRDRREPQVTTLVVDDLELDLLTRQVRRAGQKIELQPREFLLLQYLMRHAGQVVTRTMLLEDVWNYHFYPQTNVIDMHVSCLRQKVDKPFGRPLIHTVRGAGYMMHTEQRPAVPRPQGRLRPPVTA
ncbi:MAG TPA: response regulator transcription factor [Rhodopila sp.]|nr:response regulator transcription factor [Rhodopila sp.]